MPSAQLISIVAINLGGTRQGVTPCWSVNRGIDNASRNAGAGFRVDSTLIYTSGGSIRSESFQIGVSDTKKVGDFDSRTVLLEATFQLAAKVDENTDITGNAQIVSPGAAGEADDPISDPVSLTVPV